MRIAGVTQLTASSVEQHDPVELSFPINDGKIPLESICEGRVFSLEEVPAVIRMVLREHIWMRLSGDSSFYVHFGYDYNMFAGFDGDYFSLNNFQTDIFYEEEFLSPYWPEEEEELP